MMPMLKRSIVASKTKSFSLALGGLVLSMAYGQIAAGQNTGGQNTGGQIAGDRVAEDEAPSANSLDDTKGLIVRSFTQARNAFSNQQWDQASALFREVSKACPGSPLALESNYFAMLADGKLQDPKTYESMLQWLRDAKSLQDRIALAKRTAPATWESWIANTHLLAAQYERQQRQTELAERRLHGLLQIPGSERSTEWAWPPKGDVAANAWLELGLVAQECRHDWQKSLEYLQNAIQASREGSELHCRARTALVKSHIHLSEPQQVIEGIEQLEKAAPNPTWRTRSALLRSEAARANHDASAFAQALQPAIEWTLAGQTDLTTAYELALALIEARDDEHADALLHHVIERESKHPLAIEARIRLARGAIQRRDWQVAKERLDQAIDLGCSRTWIPHARLARGQVLLELGLPEAAHDDLVIALQNLQIDENTSDLNTPVDNIELETAIRFELGEALLQRQQWDDANKHWEVLIKRFPDSDAHPPKWMARVWLHQAEMQALRQNWAEAETIVSRIQSQFPECDCRDDVDYIRARCFISKARFDDARQLLNRIAREPTHPSPDLAARASWMMGETFLMQRRYAEALQAYEDVLGTGSSLYWQSAARMQIGQCYELLRDGSAARNAYQSLLDRDADGVFSAMAQQKLNSLEPTVAPTLQSNRTSNESPVGNKR
jgi:tetratricopeptide (TPR) repeat protein